MGRIALAVMCMALAACAGDQLARQGTLPNGDTFREYSRIPYGYERVIYAPDGTVKARQQLHTEENFKRIQRGMTLKEVNEVVGVGFATREDYAGGGYAYTWRYYDGVYKLLHVIFEPSGRVARYETEWDPRWYSKKDSGR